MAAMCSGVVPQHPPTKTQPAATSLGTYSAKTPGVTGYATSRSLTRGFPAFGWAQSFTRGAEFNKSYEGAFEAYYRARMTPWLHLSPHIQYIVNPGSSDIDDAVTLGLRAQITF